MVRASDLLGLPVFTTPGARLLGRVQDLLLDPEGRRIQGLVTNGNGWLRPPQLVRWGDLQSMGRDAAITRAEPAAVPDGLRWTELAGKPLLRSEGEEVGTLADLLLAEDGRIEGYLVSGGILDDLLAGHSMLTGPVALSPGTEAIYLDPPAGSPGGEEYHALS